MVDVAVLDETCDDDIASWLGDRLRRAGAELGAVGELSVAVVDDERMARLHLEHKGQAGPTDVLSFDLSDAAAAAEPGGAAAAVAGDVIVCWPEAQRQSAERGHGARAELLLYAVHGLLHLLGYDDREPGDFERMHAQEDRVLVAIGESAVYSSDSPPCGSAGASPCRASGGGS
jgi:probable rRNA maturation factor